MRYSNAPQKEDINAQDGRGEGREFLLLGITFLITLAAFSYLFVRLGAVVGPWVPFSWERKLAPDAFLSTLEAADQPMQQRLQTLADRIAAVMALPDGVHITVHYSTGSTQNAFATFGGHIVLFKGLLDGLGSEDAIAALLAHEIGHVKHRHVIKGATGGVLVGILWAGIGMGSDMAGQMGGAAQMSQLSMLSHTRAMETQADAEALAALKQLYGHAAGYFALFDALGGISQGQADAGSVPNLLRSHPKIANRVAAAIASLPQAQQSGPLTPWPAAL